MSHEWKWFLIKLIILILLSPMIGFGLLRTFEYFERVWKTGNRKKRWVITSVLFFMLACIGGWLR
jgi:hypothetical protein